MGIPKFFRWLSERYPLINKRISGTFIPEFDNLYLDMKGILHTCTHPSDARISEPLTEEEMTTRIFHYVDKIVQVIQPRNLLFLSIDGVAPQAKLNQHRQRRFRSAKDLQEAIENMKSKGQNPPENIFDSNCITAGSEFLQGLSESLQYFIKKKIDEDVLWKKIKVVYSGHEVPGEGEHKIMEWIRYQKAAGLFGEETRHCLYGLDADLIMLGLCTHEHYFSLLREDVLTRRGRFKDDIFKTPSQVDALEFQLLHLSLVREYLDLEFRNGSLPFGYDLERVIDDFVLMCFLVGNDFLPQLPGMEINDGALNKVFDIYKDVLPTLGGYLTTAGEMHLERCRLFLQKLCSLEEEIILTQELEHDEPKVKNDDDFEDAPEYYEIHKETRGEPSTLSRPPGLDRPRPQTPQGEEGAWRKRYYTDKFKTASNDPTLIQSVTSAYLDGLRWSLAYYYFGCVSWNWFYPYHYAPLVVDLQEFLANASPQEFNEGAPMLPFLQLLSVLPPFSSRLLPASYRDLVKNSSISYLFPTDYDVDMAGKRNPWEGISLIPFVDADKVTEAMKQAEEKIPLTEKEVRRNAFERPLLFTIAPESEDDNNTSLRGSSQEDIKTAPSTPLNGYFPPILSSSAHSTPYEFPLMTRETLRKAFAPQDSPKKPLGLPGFPTLSTMSFTEKLYHVGVTVFGGGGSRNESLVLDLKRTGDEDTEDEPFAGKLAKQLLGKSIFVDWPYHREGQVVGVSDRSFKYTSGSITPVTDDDAAWDKEARLQHSHFLYKKGIDVGEVKILLHIQLLKGVLIHVDGSRTKIWSDQEQTRPYQVSVENIPQRLIDLRYEEKPSIPLEDLFPIGKEVIILDKGAHFGQRGKVIEHDFPQNRVQVEFEPVVLGEPTFGHRISLQLQEKYSPLHIVSKKLGISPRVLSKVTGSIYVEPGRRNMGLNIKFTGKNQQVQGYTRKVERLSLSNLTSSSPNPSLEQRGGGFGGSITNSYNNPMALLGSIERPPSTPTPTPFADALQKQDTWEFSEKAIKLIETYKTKFPEFFEAIERAVYEDTLISVDLFPDGEHERKIREIQDWLRAQDTASLPRVPCKGSLCMSDEAFAAVQEASSKYHSFLVPVTKKKTLSRAYFSPEDLLGLPVGYDNNSGGPHYQVLEQFARTRVHPDDAFSSGGFRLGDRVMNIRPTGFVPFGLKGTVVELVYRSASILFDTEFIGGTTLNRRCKPFRGLNGIPLRELLNLSQGSLTGTEGLPSPFTIQDSTPFATGLGPLNASYTTPSSTLRRSFEGGFSSIYSPPVIRNGPPPGVNNPPGLGLRPNQNPFNRLREEKPFHRSNSSGSLPTGLVQHPSSTLFGGFSTNKDWQHVRPIGKHSATNVTSILAQEEEEEEDGPLFDETTTTSISSIIDEDDIAPISAAKSPSSPAPASVPSSASSAHGPGPIGPPPSSSSIANEEVVGTTGKFGEFSQEGPPGLSAPGRGRGTPRGGRGRGGRGGEHHQRGQYQQSYINPSSPVQPPNTSHLNWQQQQLLYPTQPGSPHPHPQSPSHRGGRGRAPYSPSHSHTPTSNAYSSLEEVEPLQPQRRQNNRPNGAQRYNNSGARNNTQQQQVPTQTSTSTTNLPHPSPPSTTAISSSTTGGSGGSAASSPNVSSGQQRRRPQQQQRKRESPKQSQRSEDPKTSSQLTWQQKQLF